jgi:hypothetical protein
MDVFAMEEAARHRRERRLATAERERMVACARTPPAQQTRGGVGDRLIRLLGAVRPGWFAGWLLPRVVPTAEATRACAEGVAARRAA